MTRKTRWGVTVAVILLLSITLIASSANAAAPRVVSMRQHVFGGFNITNAKMVNAAASEGITEAQFYKGNPSPSSPQGQALNATGMHQLDTVLWTLLYEYECHRSKTAEPAGVQYCPKDYPLMTSPSVLLGYVSSHLRAAKNNPLIDAYWVLDDWPWWDDGGAKVLLQQIHSLIQQYTPTRPAICGFGAEFGFYNDVYWSDSAADNFSPQGCDMVGLYIYSAYLPINNPPPPSSDAFDWSMSLVFPQVFNSLSQRGWNVNNEPFIGIGQAFAGTSSDNTYKIIQPSPQNMATQALSFCQHGSIGVYWYAWDTASQFVKPQTPMTNSQIAQGIQQGIAACTNYWNGH